MEADKTQKRLRQKQERGEPERAWTGYLRSPATKTEAKQTEAARRVLEYIKRVQPACASESKPKALSTLMSVQETDDVDERPPGPAPIEASTETQTDDVPPAVVQKSSE